MELVHTLNRGVDKRKIFLDDQDRFRFVHDLFEFNNEEWVNTTFYSFRRSNDIASRNIKKEEMEIERERKMLVNIHAFCIMQNHYHLILSPKKENGISRFMKKLNMGYAKYFNQKYKRTGALFEGRYKSIPLKNEAHFVHILYYLHLNPLDFISPEWRKRELKNYKKAIRILNSYRWSSHLDYAGKHNFPSVTDRSLFLDFFGGTLNYRKSIERWLKDLDFSENSNHFFLE